MAVRSYDMVALGAITVGAVVGTVALAAFAMASQNAECEVTDSNAQCLHVVTEVNIETEVETDEVATDLEWTYVKLEKLKEGLEREVAESTTETVRFVPLPEGPNHIAVVSPNTFELRFDDDTPTYKVFEMVEKLEALKQLESLRGLEKLEVLKQLEGLRALESLRALEELEGLNVLEVSGDGVIVLDGKRLEIGEDGTVEIQDRKGKRKVKVIVKRPKKRPSGDAGN